MRCSFVLILLGPGPQPDAVPAPSQGPGGPRPRPPGCPHHHHLPHALIQGRDLTSVHITRALNVPETMDVVVQYRLDKSLGMARPAGRRQLPLGRRSVPPVPRGGGTADMQGHRGSRVSQGQRVRGPLLRFPWGGTGEVGSGGSGQASLEDFSGLGGVRLPSYLVPAQGCGGWGSLCLVPSLGCGERGLVA